MTEDNPSQMEMDSPLTSPNSEIEIEQELMELDSQINKKDVNNEYVKLNDLKDIFKSSSRTTLWKSTPSSSTRRGSTWRK